MTSTQASEGPERVADVTFLSPHRGTSIPGYRGEPRCRVCASKHRDAIDQLLTTHAYSSRVIAETFAESRISAKSIQRHLAKRHFSTYEKRRAATSIQKRREETGAQDETVVDVVLLGREVIRQVWERLVVGEIHATVQDAVKLGAIVQQHDQLGSSPDVLDRLSVVRFFWAMLSLTEERLEGLPQWKEYREAILTHPHVNPVLAALNRMRMEDPQGHSKAIGGYPDPPQPR